MLYGKKVAVCSEMNTKPTHTVWAENKTCWCIAQAVDFQMLIINCLANALKKCISAVSNFVIFFTLAKIPLQQFAHSRMWYYGISLILCLVK
jgi:hypothetical protein